MEPPLEQICYSCRILVHEACEYVTRYQGVEGPCLCRVNDHKEDRDAPRDYEPLSPIPEHVGHGDNAPVGWQSVLAAYGLLAREIDTYNRMIEPGRRVHIPFAIQEVLADYIEERKAIESIANVEEDEYVMDVTNTGNGPFEWLLRKNGKIIDRAPGTRQGHNDLIDKHALGFTKIT